MRTGLSAKQVGATSDPLGIPSNNSNMNKQKYVQGRIPCFYLICYVVSAKCCSCESRGVDLKNDYFLTVFFSVKSHKKAKTNNK